MLLVVEDDVVLQLALTAMLRREGYEVQSARSVAEARQRLSAGTPEVLLLDLNLPDGNGFDILGQIPVSYESPLVIVTTGNDSLESAVEALRLGAFDYLTKPINTELMKAAIRRAIEHQRLRRSTREVAILTAHKDAMRATARAAAHHLSQHLTVIMGEAQLLLEELHDPEARFSLERIVRSTEHAAQVLAGLRHARHFVTKDAFSHEPILDIDAAQTDLDSGAGDHDEVTHP